MMREKRWFPILYMFVTTAVFSSIVIGIDADKQTVTGIAFYEQNETPGLGAEIAQPAFRNQFEGKVLTSGEKPIRFRRPGEDLGTNEVHAVTGATQTSTRVEAIINESIKQWQSEVGRKGVTP